MGFVGFTATTISFSFYAIRIISRIRAFHTPSRLPPRRFHPIPNLFRGDSLSLLPDQDGEECAGAGWEIAGTEGKDIGEGIGEVEDIHIGDIGEENYNCVRTALGQCQGIERDKILAKVRF